MIVRLERSGGWHETEERWRELQKTTLFERLQMVRGDVGDGGGEIEAIYMPPRWLRRK